MVSSANLLSDNDAQKMSTKKRSSSKYAPVPDLVLFSQETESEDETGSSDEEKKTISRHKHKHVRVKVETSSSDESEDEEEQKVSKNKSKSAKMIPIYEEQRRKVRVQKEGAQVKRPVKREFDEEFTRRFVHMVRERGGCDNLAAQRRLTEARFMFNYFPNDYCWHSLGAGFVFHKPNNECGYGRPFYCHFETVADALFECCKAPCSTCYNGHVRGTKYTV